MQKLKLSAFRGSRQAPILRVAEVRMGTES